jgi:pyrroloquinoline quinone biosynthesis protein B
MKSAFSTFTVMRHLFLLLLLPILSFQPVSDGAPYIVVLGIAQDAGYPHIGCKRDCCTYARNEDKRELVNCLGLVDPVSGQRWLIEASPDLPEQLTILSSFQAGESIIDGIFTTHGHMGHYTGLMYLGREALGSKEVSVYAMPRMKQYLTNNGPWSQLVSLKNIVLKDLRADQPIQLNDRLSITPFRVPHRDEYTETVGYKIETPEKSLIFIPDIDKWQKWDRDIVEEIKKTDYALLDGSFYANGELPNRDMSEIPHPFVVESMELLESVKDKVTFIHFNHTNPLLRSDSDAYKAVRKNGFGVAFHAQTFPL